MVGGLLLAKNGVKPDMIRPVAYLRYGKHGTCHGRNGRNFQGGAKIAWHNKNFYLQFLEPLF